jgi:menaquinol-cytochrome c reductase iron-sulfur subunit
MSAASEEKVPFESRRRLLAGLFWAGSAAAAAIVATPLVGFLLGPLFRRQQPFLVRVGPVATLPIDEPRMLEFAVRRRNAWATTTGRGSAWVVRRRDGITVFDPRCTHLGCAYHWHAPTRQFLCPCHAGVYDSEGRVVSGPPPRPLDVYPARIEDGVLYVTPTPSKRA